MDMERLRGLIRDVPDYPRTGVVFKDITPLLANAEALALAIEALARPYVGAGVDVVAGIESRGFIFGSAVARQLGAGFVPVRKPGKLPARTVRRDYQLEYGADAVEIHADAFQAGQRVLLIDDVLATGGTLAATCELVSVLGADVVGAAILLELGFLQGRRRLPAHLHLHCLLADPD